MAGWLDRLRGKGPAVPDGVPKQWADRLGAMLEPLAGSGGQRKQLAADIAEYVLTGEPAGVLHRVQSTDVETALGTRRWQMGGPKNEVLKAFYSAAGLAPPEALLRWAYVLAATTATPYGCLLRLPGGATWPEMLIRHASQTDGWNKSNGGGLTLAQLERLQQAAGWDPATLLVAAVQPPTGREPYGESSGTIISRMPDVGPALARHRDAVRAGFPAHVVAELDHLPALLGRADDDTLRTLAAEVVRVAAANSKQLRAEATPLVLRIGDAAVPPLRVLAVEGRPDQRARALELLWERATTGAAPDEELAGWARDTAAADRAGSVRDLLTRWQAATEAPAEPVSYDYRVPQIDWAVEITPGLTRFLDTWWDRLTRAVEKENARRQAWAEHQRAAGYKGFTQKPLPLPDRRSAGELLDQLRRPQPPFESARPSSDVGWYFVRDLLVQQLTADVTPVALVKLLVFHRLLRKTERLHAFGLVDAFRSLHDRSGRPDLLELSALLEPIGHPPEELLEMLCTAAGSSLTTGWPDEQVWPFVAHHLTLAEGMLLRTTSSSWGFNKTRLFQLLAALPSPAPSTVSALFQLALGPGKSDRPAAQEALDRFPDKESRIIAALADAKAENRTVAAQWLARLRHEPAVPALEAAVRKEKNDVAKGALLDALERLGRPVENYLALDALPAEAAKALKKGLPAALSWLDPEQLPPVRWAASGTAVPTEVLTWFLVQAAKQKTSEPNAVLRLYCSLFDPADRERFGQWVLERWVAADLQPVSPDVALANATQQVTWEHQYVNKHPQDHAGHRFLGVTLEQAIAMQLPSALRQPAGSANDSKGVLAVAAACAGAAAAPVAARYLKEWYGQRLAQGRALVVMLAWIDHPAATQLMLAVGSRFRTKGIQDEAVRQAEALAERRGWSVEELADRTLPSAGFDENGEQELSYGPRSITAVLQPDLTVALRSPEGKPLTALPGARQGDDPEAVAAAKKTLAAVKKELKGAVTLQTDRLYEALCTQRSWVFEDWDRYLNRHPLGRHLAQRLVWVQVGGQDDPATGLPPVLASFRPLDDGSLTDVEDDEVTLPPDARIRLAHDWLLTPEQVGGWQAHLVDYQVTPLFTQLGKGVHRPTAEQLAGTAVTDRRGHVLEAFALRGRAGKLGWTRGQAEDGGWFMTYLKRFPGVGLQAEIQFTGNTLPEENRTVALQELGFSRLGDEQWSRSMVRLAEVPPVLLSECIGDLYTMAADGPGFRDDWEKVTGW